MEKIKEQIQIYKKELCELYNNNRKYFSKKTVSTFLVMLLMMAVLFQYKAIRDDYDRIIDSISTSKTNMRINIEDAHRWTARAMAYAIWDCMMKDITDNKYTTIEEFSHSFNKCWIEQRNWGLTWDGFVVDTISMTMVADWSPDCLKGWEWRCFNHNKELIRIKNWEQQWECWMHSDPKLCQEAIAKLYNIRNTDEWSWIYWKFDDSYEWLESYTIPTRTTWFNGSIWKGWVIDKDNIQLMIVVWTQEDEVMKRYEKSFNSVNYIEKMVGTYKMWINIIMLKVMWLLFLMWVITILAVKKKYYGTNTNICDV